MQRRSARPRSPPLARHAARRQPPAAASSRLARVRGARTDRSTPVANDALAYGEWTPGPRRLDREYLHAIADTYEGRAGRSRRRGGDAQRGLGHARGCVRAVSAADEVCSKPNPAGSRHHCGGARHPSGTRTLRAPTTAALRLGGPHFFAAAVAGAAATVISVPAAGAAASRRRRSRPCRCSALAEPGFCGCSRRPC